MLSFIDFEIYFLLFHRVFILYIFKIQTDYFCAWSELPTEPVLLILSLTESCLFEDALAFFFLNIFFS